MTYSESAQTTARRIPRLLAAGLLVVVAVLGYRLLAPSPWATALPADVAGGERPQPQPAPRQAPREAVPPGGIPRDQPQPDALGEAGGALPGGTTVFDHAMPGVANLDRALLDALRQAATDAARDGVEFSVNSGWRSPEYQNQLFREAVAKYGSEEEAARWVASAGTSPHVSGGAIDIGPSDAMAWLSERGAEYGLCQIYRNEPWHYELRPAAIEQGCPPMYADPTYDPRMQGLGAAGPLS